MTTELDRPRTDVAATKRTSAGTEVVMERLTRSYGATKALDDLSLTIRGGEFIALLGPSGCGKTTALRVLAGFERADAGRVLLDGTDVSPFAPQRRGMGMVFQSYSLFPNMTAQENVAFGLRLRGQKSAVRKAAAIAQLEAVGLLDHVKKYPHQLSGGQQQRVALARALAIEPRVLLLDEPLSALDAKVRVELREQIRSLQQRLGITTVFVTHDQEEALSMADRVCVMQAGKIEQVASPDILYSAPTTPFVASFVGVSSRLRAQFDGTHAVILGTAIPSRPGTMEPAPGAVIALLRPEDLDVVADRDGNGTVVHRSFLGSTLRLDVLVGDEIAKVDVRGDLGSSFEMNTRVHLKVRASDVLLITPTGSSSEVTA